MRAAGQQVHDALSRKVTSRSSALLSPLPVANGRAQPKVRAGSKKHKREHKLSHWHRPPGRKETHFLLRQHAHSHLRLGEEREKHRTGPGQCVNSAPLPPSTWGGQKQHCSPSRRETLACGSGPSEAEALSLSDTRLVPAHRPQLVAPFKSITVPQTQKQDRQSQKDAEGSLGFP